ncbi:MAG: DUF4292 domain-containing protein [Luteibaculum sp.]
MRSRIGWISSLTLALCTLFSCASKKTLTDMSKMGCKDIIQRIEKGNDFPQTFAGKYSCEVRLPDNSVQKFSSIVRSVRGELTSVSISPLLGIELFRLYLFPDSIIFLNKLDKQYYTGSYDYLSQEIGSEVSLELFQDLLSAQPIKYADSDRYKCDRSKDRYIVKNVPSRKLRKGLGILKDESFEEDPDSVYVYTNINKKLAKAFKKDDDIFLKRYFSDSDFNLRRVIIHEVEKNQLLEINYGEQQNFGGIQIPSLIEVDLTSGEKRIKITINPSKFKEIDDIEDDFSIPEKYERIVFN